MLCSLASWKVTVWSWLSFPVNVKSCEPVNICSWFLSKPLGPPPESVRNTPSAEPLPPATASSQVSCPSEIMVDPEGSYHGSSTTEEEPSYSSNLPPLRSAHPHAHAHPLKSFAVPAIPAGSHPSYESSALPSPQLHAQAGEQTHSYLTHIHTPGI